jgi:diguanylate cyclase (GGDEF)-like protein/PAS domain S-box-containing protein
MYIQDKEKFAPLEIALENVGRSIFLFDKYAQFLYANHKACMTLGYNKLELMRLHLDDVDPDYPAHIWSSLIDELKVKQHSLIESQYRAKDGRLFPAEISSYHFVYQHDDYVLAFVRDISDRDSLKEQLRLSETKFRTLVEHSPDVIIRYDKHCKRIFINGAYERAYGLSADLALGKLPSEAWGKSSMPAEEFEAKLRHVMATGKDLEVELEWRDANDYYMAQALYMTPERDDYGVINGVLTFSRNITERNLLQQKLSKNEEDFRTLVEHSPDSIIRYDTQCRRTYVSPKALKELDCDLDFLLGKTPTEFPDDASAILIEQKVKEVIKTGKYLDFELINPDNKICTHMRMTPEFDAKNNVTHVLAIGRDITEIDRYRKQIHQQAFFDNLTALPNRALLLDRIAQVVADASRHQFQFGLMILDLDHFKEINDTLGHNIGDLLLCEVAKRLRECVRPYDTVARLGGDEFAILITQIPNGQVLSKIAQVILKSLVLPFVIDSKELFVSISIGIAVYPMNSDEIDGLFKYADSAMYSAKKQGRNNFQFYDKELTLTANKRRLLEVALRKAKQKDELEVYYQPQIDMPLNILIGAEALLRWNHPEFGPVSPDIFIPILEESGLITDVGEWVMRTAFKQAAIWNSTQSESNADAKPFVVAINLSTRQFIRNDLIMQIKRSLKSTGCKTAWIKLEITESLLLEDNEDTKATLKILSGMGLTISIDDFGTGYSALGYLNRFPVNQIKLDRSFVCDIPANIQKSALVKAMLSIARALDPEVVAEGVESSENSSYLISEGCRLGQGYFFGKPMSLSAFNMYMSTAKMHH